MVREEGGFGDRLEREAADRRADRTGPTAAPRSAEQRPGPAPLRMCHCQADGTGFHEKTLSNRRLMYDGALLCRLLISHYF